TNLPTALRIPRAMRCTCSSLSITHGPAIKTRGPPPKALNAIVRSAGARVSSEGTRVLWLRLQFLRGGFGFRQALAAEFLRRLDERLEQRVRFHRFRLKLGVELAAQIPGMPGDL